ncbi:uncharacterized protein [Clytia hemisphaerica]
MIYTRTPEPEIHRIKKFLQSLVKSESGKRNIRRTIERKTNDFVFLSRGKTIFLYPSSWEKEDIVSELYEAKLKLAEIDQAQEPKAVVCQSGSIMRKEIKDIDYTMPWPPSPEDMNAIDFQIPEHLDSFLSVLLSGNINSQSDRVNRLKLSFAQDLVYAVHNGEKLTPKSCLLACQIKDLTNNVELIRTMNKLGHGISYDVVQSLLTEVAYQKVDSTDGEKVQLPETTEKETFAMLAEDNIDRLEETLSGEGTTHKVNSIIIQPDVKKTIEIDGRGGSFTTEPVHTKRRSFKSTPTLLEDYILGKRVGPKATSAAKEDSFADILCADQVHLYNTWVALRIHQPIMQHVPSWTGFFIKIRQDIPIRPSQVGYLDCLDAPATEMSTIYHMLERAIRIKDQLNVKSIVCVYDQAIYAKAYQIKCKEPEKFKSVFLMMGTFHIIMTFLAVLATRFKDAGLKDLVIQSVLVAEGSVDTMFSGSRAYKRAVRAYKILYEAFSRLLLEKFKKEHPKTVKALYDSIGSKTIENYTDVVSSTEMQEEYSNKLVSFKESLSDKGDLPKFWLTFLEMCELLFNIIFATRSGHWSLYLVSLRQALPWFFAYDRPNYSRYLTAHYQELTHLKEDFPDIYDEFQSGNFSVQLSSDNPFGRMEADKVIETTINKDTKTPGGTTGFSTNHGAVQRWVLTAAYRAEVRKHMQEFLSMSRNSKHPDLSPARIRRDQKDVKNVKDTIDSMFINPFEECDLMSLTSGVAPTEEVKDQLLDAEMLGENALVKFQQERLQSNEVDFFATLNRLNLGTFTKLLRKTVKMPNGKEAQFSTQSNIFGKIALIQQFRQLDLKEVFRFPLGPVPWSLAESNGSLNKTTKSSLMHHLEKDVAPQQKVDKPFAAIIDGMALVRKVKPTGHTYQSYADHLLASAISSSGNASRVDIVFDVYRDKSIKNAEREREPRKWKTGDQENHWLSEDQAIHVSFVEWQKQDGTDSIPR